jgi:hypothetical protein
VADQLGRERQLFPFAISGLRGGLSGNQILAAARDAGLAVRRQQGLRVIAQARQLIATHAADLSRDQNAVPSFSERANWPTNGATGVIQHVQLFYQERVTGRIVVQHYGVKSDRGVSRQEAVNIAIDAYAGAAEEYEQDLIQAFHTGASNLVSTQVA